MYPGPGALGPGQVFGQPDDAFISPDGRSIVATQEMDDTISVIDIATGRITRWYGHPGVPGSGPGYFFHPDDVWLPKIPYRQVIRVLPTCSKASRSSMIASRVPALRIPSRRPDTRMAAAV